VPTENRKLAAILFADMSEVQFCPGKTECPVDILRSEPEGMLSLDNSKTE